MTSSNDQQTEILRLIWQEIKALKSSFETRLDATREELSSRLDATREELSSRIDETNERLDAQHRRTTESEMRLATATTQLAGDVQGLTGIIQQWREDHRTDRETLARRVTRLEKHTGLVESAS